MQTLYLENSPIAYYIDDTANNDWVVFVHAAFVDHRMFEKQFNYFAGKYNLLAIDILGHGNSINAKKGDTIEKMSDWISGIFQKHNIAAAHFVGVSLGSVFIQDFANKYEDKVLSLACFGGYDINNFDLKRQQSNSKGQMMMMLKALFSIKWFAKANKKISAYTTEAQEEFYRLNLQFKKSSFMYLAKLQNFVNKYPQKQRPYSLLVGCGEHDIPMEIEIVNEWAEYENCDKVIFQGAGHCVNMDKPNEFNNYMENFWLNYRK
ncbi:MAG: alpha/beta hydrolase [Clostridiales bacterium]|nr:alpha/beta hydrolase [Clostridiales bacterium]